MSNRASLVAGMVHPLAGAGLDVRLGVRTMGIIAGSSQFVIYSEISAATAYAQPRTSLKSVSVSWEK
jgi:hypothetical protein